MKKGQMTTIPAPQWREASQAIEEASSIVLVTHVNPDGDAIGSLLGLSNALQAMGKTVTAAVDGGVPDFLAFLPGAAGVVASLEQGEWDLMISTDASDEERTGLVGSYARAHSKQVINLDHHVTNTLFGQIHLVVPEAVSATEIVFLWWKHLGIALDRVVTMPLLTGLVTDTMGFRTSSVKADTLGIAQALMQAGASLTEVTARTLDSKPYKAIDLWKLALPTTELEDGVIYATATLDMLMKTGMDESVTGGLVSFLLQVEEAMVAVVFKQKALDQVEISLRAKRGYDVAKVAHELGGGGHTQASGATVKGNLEEVLQKVLPMLHGVVRDGALEIV